ncbi:hypothetical protein M9H77_17277 [Catharanthus roseus]|uniref:Uncharacterized protein n=1 Tax=Catharanthus roseus TaxID=4058 RepID=A0ACC0B460_CATRO|nr:hypothetical protein M9H77_17277 [Catharanthus roseus]
MYEITQNVDLFVKVDALSKNGNYIFEKKKYYFALKHLEVKTRILDSHTQSIVKLETQIGQLVNAISRRDEGKLPSLPIENPRANYHEQAKAVITLRNGKLVDNKIGETIKDSDLNENDTEGIDMETKIEKKLRKVLVFLFFIRVTDLCHISVITLARLTLEHMGRC